MNTEAIYEERGTTTRIDVFLVGKEGVRKMTAKEKLLEFVKGLTDEEVKRFWEEMAKYETERGENIVSSH
jgi:hypothetical protein